MVLLKAWLSLRLLTPSHQVEEFVPPEPDIISFTTSFPEEPNWVTLPIGTKEITFYVEAENTDTVLFWLIPTGTATWKLRELIGYDIKSDDNKFSHTWKIDKPSLHDSVQIQALGISGIRNAIINLHMDPSTASSQLN
ncbi:hypothetical protein [Bacillus sp. SM2101]|uniref:hypothetical protein n=1 Tax=Bacillus sp. SM2101 TaxID=2805366 RepID=UPI001BDF51F4|nr:hypothetical protein [Bacillus sp. SM2101]